MATTSTVRGHADTALPPVVSTKEWQEARDQLLISEKAHTHAGDAVAAQRRRLPMTEVDATVRDDRARRAHEPPRHVRRPTSADRLSPHAQAR